MGDKNDKEIQDRLKKIIQQKTDENAVLRKLLSRLSGIDSPAPEILQDEKNSTKSNINKDKKYGN